VHDLRRIWVRGLHMRYAVRLRGSTVRLRVRLRVRVRVRLRVRG
jgi:hypothetical protein